MLPEALRLPGLRGHAAPIAGADDTALHATERALIANAAARRRAHFAAGRLCAHAALAALGRPVEAVLRSETGAPRWPEGVVGSITHCERQAAAVVAPALSWRALGLDVEPLRALPADVAAYALTDRERSRFRVEGCAPEASLVAFSAKECVHKCLHPLLGLFLGFEEIEIAIDTRGFTPLPRSARAEAALAPVIACGRWAIADGCVWTLLALA